MLGRAWTASPPSRARQVADDVGVVALLEHLDLAPDRRHLLRRAGRDDLDGHRRARGAHARLVHRAVRPAACAAAPLGSLGSSAGLGERRAAALRRAPGHTARALCLLRGCGAEQLGTLLR
jgi:hypothetical protein